MIVDGGSYQQGAYQLKVTLDEAIPEPENNSCEGAIELVSEQSGDTRGASHNFTPASSCSYNQPPAPDLVYRLVVDQDEDVKLSLAADFDASLSVTAGPCGEGEVLACSSGHQLDLLLPALEAGEYFVWVDAYSQGAGRFDLSVDRQPPTPLPGNDLCENAEFVDLSSGSAQVGASTSRASPSLSPKGCLRSNSSHPDSSIPLLLDGRDLVYELEIPAQSRLVANLSPDFDAALYLLDSCNANACLAASDEFADQGEELVFENPETESRQVFLVVDSWREQEYGAFTLNLQVEPL